MNKPEAVLILSGGMDSATLLWDLLDQGISVVCLMFDYGQRHKAEIGKASELCELARVRGHILTLEDSLGAMGGSSQTDLSIPVPEGRYDDTNMKLTVVPNRNMVMLSMAIAFAISERIPRVYYGAHAGDHAIYPDCRPEFVEAMQVAARLCDWTPVEILAPYLKMTKGEIVVKGLGLGVPYGQTMTCYKGGILACGKCGSCSERLEAFAFAGAKDPVEYRGGENVSA